MEALFCINCGEKLIKDACFCIKCGARVPKMEDSQTAEVPAPEVISEAEAPAAAWPVTAVPEMEPVIVVPEAEPVPPEAEPVVPETVPVFVEEQAWVEPDGDKTIPMNTDSHKPEVEPVVTAVQEPPVYTAPAPSPTPAPAKETAKSAAPYRRGVGRTILAVLLSLVVFVLSITTVMLFGLRSAASESEMKALFTDAVDNLDSVSASLFNSEAEEDETLIDLIVEFLNTEGLNPKSRDVKKLLTDPEFIDPVFEKLYAYVIDIRNGTRKATLSERDVEKLLKSMDDLIEDTLDITINDTIAKEVASRIEDSGALEYTDARLLEQKVPAAYYGVQYGLSIWLVCILGGLLLLFMLLLGAANRWNLARTTGDIGITLTVIGALISIPSAVAPLFMGSLLESVPAGELIGIAAAHLLQNMLLSALCALGTGVLLLVISAVAKKIAAKRCRVSAA